jgi:F0F1-type ATP synthase assembly protein I
MRDAVVWISAVVALIGWASFMALGVSNGWLALCALIPIAAWILFVWLFTRHSNEKG